MRVAATPRMPSSVASRSSSSSRTLRSKSRPTAVSVTRRVVRSSRRTPSACSSLSTRRLNAGCDRCTDSAALRKLLSSATARKASRSFRSKLIAMANASSIDALDGSVDLKDAIYFCNAGADHSIHEPSDPLRSDACRHLARPLLPARLAARRRHRARRGADRRDRRVGPAAGRRRRRRQHAHQQGRDRLEVGAIGLRRRLPVRPGRRRAEVGRHATQLRQHAVGRCAVRDRARPGGGPGRRDHGPRLQRQHPLAHRRDGADPEPHRLLRRRDRHRRRGRHGRPDPAELSGRLGRRHRLPLSDRQAHRRDRRPARHLPRCGDAARHPAGARTRPDRPRDAGRARRRPGVARATRSGSPRRGRGDGPRRRVDERRAEAGHRQRWRRRRQRHVTLLHAAPLPCVACGDRRDRRRDRVRAARNGGQRNLA